MASRSACSSRIFLSTPSAWRATRAPLFCSVERVISIHALRVEGDLAWCRITSGSDDFYPRPPRGGRRGRDVQGLPYPADFYPRPPRGGRPFTEAQLIGWRYFYPRPPRGGRPIDPRGEFPFSDFYPRPPRGGRLPPLCVAFWSTRFLSTPSAWRATRLRPCFPSKEGRFLSTPSAWRATV